MFLTTFNHQYLALNTAKEDTKLVSSFSSSTKPRSCLDQQPNPWTSAGVGGNLRVPDYNSHHL
ncbi:hypothetical protein V6Z11_D13G067700 [Gossypium hirsutum]